MLEVLGIVTGAMCISDSIDTSRKARKQQYDSIPVMMRRQQTFEESKALLSKDYAPHLKKATPWWKKER